MIVRDLLLGAGSFLFHAVVKTLMRLAQLLHDLFGGNAAQEWIVLSEDDMLARPGALPLIMTMAPRWNTHAILATLSPITVRGYLEIDTAAADRSAEAWTIVVCSYAGRRTITYISSLDSGAVEGRTRIDLPPGRYWLGLRYYRWRAEVGLPAVSADGAAFAPGRPIPPQTNDFYRVLNQRSNLFYRLLHDHVFVMLRYPGLFPEPWVRRVFLPMGNPETRFFWGALRKGEVLRARVAPQALDGWSVLLTFYSRASFPVRSEELQTTDWQCVAAEDCTYLFRVNRRTVAADAVFPAESLALQVVSPGAGRGEAG